jgi:predicted O-methyltransferase YrrM
LTLPSVEPAALGVRPVDKTGLPERYMNPGELDALVALARSVRPRVAIEIGVNEGRTAKLLLDQVPSIERYIGVDVLPGYVTAKACQRREIPARPGALALGDARFRLILLPRGSLDLSVAELGLADFVFIDGDHGRQAVLRDTALAYAIVRPGGMIVWHDYHNLETVDVRAALEEMAAAGASIQHVAGTWLAFERIAA